MQIYLNQEEILERAKQQQILGSSPGEGGFCRSETRNDRRTVPRPKFFIGRGDYRNRGRKPEKQPWVRVPVKMISLARKLSKIEEQRHDQDVCFGGAITQGKSYNPQICPGFESR
jgi:hypothetical protein